MVVKRHKRLHMEADEKFPLESRNEQVIASAY